MKFSFRKLARAFLRTFSVGVLLSILGVFGGTAVFLYLITRNLPDVTTLKSYQHRHATEVFSDDGKKIGEFTTERRYPVEFEKIPQHVINAFLAAEDSKFFQHKGIDFNGIFRAIFSNFRTGRYAQGGSTITQQVARALLLETKEKKITRKIREMVLAYRMEKQLSKREILSLYLSEIYLGHGAYGIGAASRNYFNKPVENLKVSEAAILAGLPQRPRDWDPFHDPANAKARQHYVLKRMLIEGFIDQKQFDAAWMEPLRLHAREDLTNSAAPYFTEYVRQYLMNKYGSENILSQGYRVYTTVRHDFQKVAERSVEKGLREVDKRMGWRGVMNHLNSDQQIQEFIVAQDKEVLERLNPVRVLKYQAEGFAKTLEYDLGSFRDKNSRYLGETPVSVGEINLAVVTQVEDARNAVIVQMGKTPATLPLTAMEWVKIDGQPLKKPSLLLRRGDVVQVQVIDIDKKSSRVQVSLEQEPEITGALLSFEVENGFVRAMIGGRDFNRSKFNCALQAKRQVGSTFKPVIYAAAIERGFSPSSIVTDSPIVFKFEGKLDADAVGAHGEDWRPKNFGNKFEGDIPLRLALIRSMNIPTVKILNELTVDYGIQFARAMGITSVLPRDLTIGLGSWSSSLDEMMRTYAHFPRLGRPVNLVYIRRIEDASGKVVEEVPATGLVAAAPSPSPTASGSQPISVSPQTAYVVTDMLRGVVREGTGRGASGVPGGIAGKTGTSNDHRDAWFIGYSPHLMAGVWIGYEKNDKPLDAAETGGRAATPVFSEYMKFAGATYPSRDFTVPDGVHFAYVDRLTGRLATPSNPQRVRVAFREGTVPNMTGDNLLRVGEPGGVRATATGNGVNDAGQPGGQGTLPVTQPLPSADDASDSLQQAYQ